MKSPATVIERALTDSAAGALPQETEAEVRMQQKSDAEEQAQHLAQALDEPEQMTARASPKTPSHSTVVLSPEGLAMQRSKSSIRKAPRAARRQGVHGVLPENLANAVGDLAAARRVPVRAIYEAVVSAYVSPGAQDQRDAMRARQLNRFSRAVSRSTGARSVWLPCSAI